MTNLLIALIKDEEGAYLVGKRPDSDSQASLWEFPGGSPEAGEATEKAFQRLMREKIGVEVKILKELPHFNTSSTSVRAFEVKPLGMPKRKYHSAIRWSPIDELTITPFIEGGQPVISYLEKTHL